MKKLGCTMFTGKNLAEPKQTRLFIINLLFSLSASAPYILLMNRISGQLVGLLLIYPAGPNIRYTARHQGRILGIPLGTRGGYQVYRQAPGPDIRYAARHQGRISGQYCIRGISYISIFFSSSILACFPLSDWEAFTIMSRTSQWQRNKNQQRNVKNIFNIKYLVFEGSFLVYLIQLYLTKGFTLFKQLLIRSY